MNPIGRWSFLAISVLYFGWPAPVRADEADDFFESQVRPLLTAKCAECHGETDPEGRLRLTTLAHVLKGGKSGPAAIAKKPKESLLVRAIEQTGKLKMPPDIKPVCAIATPIRIGDLHFGAACAEIDVSDAPVSTKLNTATAPITFLNIFNVLS